MEPATNPPDRRRGPVPRLIAALVIAVALVGLLYLSTLPLGGHARPSFYAIGSAEPGMQVGQIAPGSAQAPDSPRLALTDLDGAPMALAQFAGRPIWIIFWKTACEPCEAEARDVAAAYAAHEADGLVVLGIDLWDPAEEIRLYARSHALTFPIALDTTSNFMDAYGVWGAPTHYFIDSTGIIEDRYFGPMTRDLIEESLHRIM
jgi:cytochrome c biogenesis protein CcmG/thiol:disulfide interchange protein DsbE